MTASGLTRPPSVPPSLPYAIDPPVFAPPRCACDLYDTESYNPQPERGIQAFGNGSHSTAIYPVCEFGNSETEEIISKKKKKLKDKIRAAANGVVAEEARSAAIVRDYESHVFVCTGGDCKKRGAKDTRRALKDGIRSEGILGEVRIDTVDCLGLCKHGPNVVVYDGAQPKGTWYLGLDEDDAPEVVEQHLKSGEPVGRLAADRRPRKAKKAKR